MNGRMDEWEEVVWIGWDGLKVEDRGQMKGVSLLCWDGRRNWEITLSIRKLGFIVIPVRTRLRFEMGTRMKNMVWRKH